MHRRSHLEENFRSFPPSTRTSWKIICQTPNECEMKKNVNLIYLILTVFLESMYYVLANIIIIVKTHYPSRHRRLTKCKLCVHLPRTLIIVYSTPLPFSPQLDDSSSVPLRENVKLQRIARIKWWNINHQTFNCWS
jgi:hypothetical protein